MNDSMIKSQGERLKAHKALIGKVIAQRYEIKALIGLGGMGAVYRAEHALIGKPVAVKVLHKEFAHHPEGIARFQREARAAATIDHLNICAPTDFGRLADGSLFLVMEYLRGKTLAKVLENCERLTPVQVIDITRQLCNVLSKAHAEKIVHRDLKPENIMLLDWEGDGEFIKVLDFGLASMHRHEPNGVETAALTRVGIPFGTPAYMPPEQVEGQPVDGRADLYSLGAMMFEMLTGKRPFESKSIPEILTMHLREPPPSLREVAPLAGISLELEQVVHKLMAKAPEDRFANADELYQALMATPDAASFRSASDADQTMPMEVNQHAKTLAMDHSSLSLHGQKFGAAFDALPRPHKLGIIALLSLVVLSFFIILILAITDDGDNDVAEARAIAAEGLSKQVQTPDAQRGLVESLSKSRDTFISEHADLRPFLEKLAGNDRKDARALLKKANKDGSLKDNPHFHYYSGLAWERDDRTKAMEHYQQAIALDERYAFSPDVTEHLMNALASRKEAISNKAKELLMRPSLKVRGADILGEMAMNYRKKKGRNLAYTMLKDNKTMMETLPVWRRNDLALRHSSGCAEHKVAIEAIVAAGDANSIAMLQKYAKKSKRGCGAFNHKDCYACIRDELKDAINTLKAKK